MNRYHAIRAMLPESVTIKEWHQHPTQGVKMRMQANGSIDVASMVRMLPGEPKTHWRVDRITKSGAERFLAYVPADDLENQTEIEA